MTKIGLVTLLLTMLSTAPAFAGGRHHDDDYYGYRHAPHAKHVVVHHVYDEPEVIYRERVVYRERPVYVEPVRYAPPPAEAYVAVGSDRVVGQLVGAVAGGLLGNHVGRGNGRVVATAAGAVIGSVVGGNLAVGR